MLTIQTYTNTKCELEMAKTRLNLLIDKKIEIYTKYFSLSANLKEVVVDGGEENTDKMADYVYEINTVDVGTGMSIVQEISYLQKNITKLQEYLDTMDSILAKMTGIEHQLFYEIVYNGTSITQAVENIAELNEKDTSTIWKNYYNRIKKDVKTVAKFKYDRKR